MVDPWVRRFSCSTFGGATGSQGAEYALCDDGTDFTGCSRETVGGWAVSCREAFAGNDESGGVGAEVEEELCEHVKCEQGVAGKVVECKTNDDEEDSEHGESHELDGFSAQGVDGCDRYPVTGNGSGADQNKISNGVVIEYFIHVLLTTWIADCGQDDGVVETQTWVLLARI